MNSLSLASIRLDGGTQPRAVIDTELVGQYAEAMILGAVFPPMVVYFDGADYWLADGFHRYHAHAGCQYSLVDCDVRQGTQRDAILFSVGANAEHGWRRTNEDKRRAVMRLLNDAEWSGWNNSAIARQCKVDEGTVRRYRPAPSSEVPKIGAPRTVSRGGTTYQMNTAAIGSRPAPDRPIFDSTSAGERAATERWSAADIAPPSSPEKAEPSISEDMRGAWITAAFDTVSKAMAPLPEPWAAVGLLPTLHHHTIDASQFERLGRWLCDFAGAWRAFQEAKHVAAE